MYLDRLRRDVERLGDVAVRLSAGGKIRDAPLTRSQGEDACEGGRAWTRPCGVDLAANRVDERLRAADVCQFERTPQRLASLGRPTRMPKRASERGERLRLLEARGRPPQEIAGLFELGKPFAMQDRSEDAQRSTHGSRCSPAARDLDLSLG